MIRALFPALLAAFVIGSAFAKSVTAGEVTFASPCECQGQKNGSRWAAKTDPSPVPADKSTIQSVTPSQIYDWKGPEPNVPLTPETNTRIPAEQKWYNLTGSLVSVKVESDGDITLVLKDADSKKAGSVNAEIPCFRLDDAELSFQFQRIPKARTSRAARHHGHRQSALRCRSCVCGSF